MTVHSILKDSGMIAGLSQVDSHRRLLLGNTQYTTSAPHDSMHKDCAISTHQGKLRRQVVHLSCTSNFTDVTISLRETWYTVVEGRFIKQLARINTTLERLLEVFRSEVTLKVEPCQLFPS